VPAREQRIYSARWFNGTRKRRGNSGMDPEPLPIL
jgi:hypothetical protein